jgi:hypothetical protein
VVRPTTKPPSTLAWRLCPQWGRGMGAERGSPGEGGCRPRKDVSDTLSGQSPLNGVGFIFQDYPLLHHPNQVPIDGELQKQGGIFRPET